MPKVSARHAFTSAGVVLVNPCLLDEAQLALEKGAGAPKPKSGDVGGMPGAKRIMEFSAGRETDMTPRF
jgi:hypothetical protein